MPRVPKTKKQNALTGVHARKTPVLHAPGGKLCVDPPTGLTADARAAWALAIESCGDGHLTAVNIGILERWCRNYAMYRKLAKIVEHDGMFTVSHTGDNVPSAETNLMIRIQKEMLAIEKELGFTPSSRARVRIDDDGEEEVNPFDFNA